MCGIAGLINNNSNPGSRETLRRMCENLQHRGPDGGGYWHDAEERVHLGHRRLSIIDLSEAANQPMQTDSKRFTIVFNGEIYNYQELKTELLAGGSRFKTQSDTEVILNAIEAWGLVRTLQALHGMFAIAVWDEEERTLYLARDYSGEKPLYFGGRNCNFFFASELNALRGVPEMNSRIRNEAVGEFFRYSYVPAPMTIYENTFKLLPGHYMKYNAQIAAKYPVSGIPMHPYWDHMSLKQDPITGKSEMLREFDATLHQIVRQQMISDVPLGAFLSGGIDSSLIVSVMQRNSSRRINTYTIGFEDPDFNEAPFAAKIAQHIGTDHHEYRFTTPELKDLATSVPALFDEPFGDSSQIPTYLLSRFVRKHVTVSLSGDGGDEVFGGYKKYLRAREIHRKVRNFPVALLKSIEAVAGLSSTMGAKFTGLAKWKDPASLYNKLSTNQVPRSLLTSGPTPALLLRQYDLPATELLDQLMYYDFKTYLPDDIMVKVDRMAMANSLETRTPFLDKRMLAFSARIPNSEKINTGVLKYITRQLLEQYIPASLFNRPKKGFSVPLRSWFAQPANRFIDEVFHTVGPQNPYLHFDTVQAMLSKHRSGQADCSNMLWNIFVWYIWYERNAG